MILADNGGDWFISGAPNAAFNSDDLSLLVQLIPNTTFEVVDTSAWRVSANSAQSSYVPGGVPSPPPPPPPPPIPPGTTPPTIEQRLAYRNLLLVLHEMQRAVTDGAIDATNPDYVAQKAAVKAGYRKEFLDLF